MDTFSFVFSLFGLLLGFSFAEVLGGMTRALRLRHRVRIGWITPLLGLFVMLDVTGFWAAAWQARATVQPSFEWLVFGLFVTGIYYFAASLVFPADPAEWPDFDEYYFAHRRLVLTCILVSHTAVGVLNVARAGTAFALSPLVLVPVVLFYLLTIGALLLRSRRWSAALLGLLVLLYLAAALPSGR